MFTKNIYLASKSPRRRMLLKKLGMQFKILNPQINEKISKKNPRHYAMELAKQKVMAVEDNIQKGVIIGVDTIVVINNKILNKPHNKTEARSMLKLLSRRQHKVISGIYILLKPQSKFWSKSEVSYVKFRKLSKNEIEQYISTREPYDKAGGYGIQEQASVFVEKLAGCYFNVVGLPISKLLFGLKSIIESC
jgi:septum formation protein